MTKISRPSPKDVFLRHRLFERLDHMRRFPVIWISAPAGSGKTTLVSSYIGDRNIPCLWYQIDKGDADPATFFYYMREAAKKTMPRKRLSLPLLTPEYYRGISTFVLRYFECLYDRLTIPFIMVFDNFQKATLDSPFQEAMSDALSIIPEGINVIVISRNDLPASFSRLRANRSIGLVGWEDIRFTEEESMGIISRGVETLPPKKMMRSLYGLSDGWVAGLILLDEGCRKGTQIPKLAGKEVFNEVFEYFASEIFRHLDPKSREFFLTTAFLPKMTVHMAEQLTGNRTADSILNAMNRNNFFIIRHSGPKAVYEYHPLCRHFLRSRAKADFSPEHLSAVRRAAAFILEEEDMTESAVVLLKDIADWESMIDIIIAHAPDMIKQGRHRMLQSWMERIPAEAMEKNPRLLFWEGMSILPFNPGRACTVFEKAFARFQAASDTIGSMLAASGVINSIINQYDNFSPLDHWYEILNNLALRMGKFPDEETEAWVFAGLITAAVLREKYSSETEIWEKQALNIKETPATINTKAQALRFIFWRRLLWKGVSDALPLLHELRRLSRLRRSHPVLSIIAHSADVQYYLCTGSHNELVEAARKGLSISQETGIHLEDLWFYIHTAASFINRMDCKGAHAWLKRIPPMDEDRPKWASATYHIQLMRIALIEKELDDALFEGKKALDFAISSGSPIALANVQLLLAQLFQIMGKREEALKLLDQARAYAESKNSRQMMMEVLRNDAQFAFDEGDEDKGLSLLGKCLALAKECGCMFMLFDNPVTTIGLCEKALESGIEVEHVKEIIQRRGLVPEKSPVHIENWPWPLKIYTLGRFSIVKDGNPLLFSGKAQQTPLRMLKALISLGAREIDWSHISSLLWPDAEGDMAHHSFEINLHRLRRLLGYSEALRLSDGRVTLENRYCWVDAWAFERLIAQADAYEQMGMKEKAWETAEKALALYRQDFLMCDSHETWVISPSERLKAKYFNNLLRLGRSLEIAGQGERAIRLYEQGLEINDRMEEIYQRLMICCQCLGKRGEALAAYDRCRKVLGSTLGIAPSRETEAIRAAILSKHGLSKTARTDVRPGN